MKIDSTSWTRIIISSILMASIIFVLKLIFGLISELIPILIAIFIPFLLIRSDSIKEAAIYGLITGALAGLIASILFLAPLAFLTVIWIPLSIVGTIISYFVFKKNKAQ